MTDALDLDDLADIERLDPDGALTDVENAAWQWEEAGNFPVEPLPVDRADAVVVVGMGGSGVVADLASLAAGSELQVPVVPHKDYGLPAFVGERTVVVAASYSGETAETLDATRIALERGAHVLAVTTGGTLSERCRAAGAAVVHVPGLLQPRHSTGYLAVPVLRALGLVEDLGETVAALAAVTDQMGRLAPTERNALKQVAPRLAEAPLVVALGVGQLGGVVATRLKNQLNENAKHVAHAAVLPEAAHNELVGWEPPAGPAGTQGVWLRDPESESGRLEATVQAVEQLLADRLPAAVTLEAPEGSLLARCAALMSQVDLLSIYVALARGVDPTPVRTIDALKEALKG